VKKETNKSKDNLLDIVIDAIEEKKGNNILVIDLKKVEHAIADYFVICHAESTVQVSAIADYIEEMAIKKANERPRIIEGRQNSQWILIDLFNIVVHVFQEESRAFYKLEDLWSDGNFITIKEK